MPFIKIHRVKNVILSGHYRFFTFLLGLGIRYAFLEVEITQKAQ